MGYSIDAVLLVLVTGIGIGTIVSAISCFLLARRSRRWGDETVSWRLHIAAIAFAFLSGLFVWIFVDSRGEAFASLAEPIAFAGSSLPAAVFGALAAGLAGGVVGTAGISSALSHRPDLADEDRSTVRRRYARDLTLLTLVVFGILSAVGPFLRTGLVGIVIGALGIGFWVGGPLLGIVLGSTRAPTDTENARIDRLLETAELSPRSVRVFEGGEQQISIELSGAPTGRVLFCSEAALEKLDDSTLTALLACRKQQARHLEGLWGILTILLPVVPVAGVLLADLPVLPGLALALLLVFGGLAGTRRLRLRADDRAAEAIGTDALVTAFERSHDAAGISLHRPTRTPNWLSATPSMTRRVTRLRERTDCSSS